jgi:ATP synthase protein I
MGRGKKQLRRARLWLDVSIVGIQFPVSIAIGYFFGHWLDKQFGTDPWLTITFALFGIVAGFVNLFRITAQAARAEEEIGKLEGAEDGKEDDDPVTS